MSVGVRPWRPGDADAVAALSARLAAPDPRWTPAQAAARLSGELHGHGRDVAVAVRGGTTVGVLAAIPAPPWMYVWPFWTDDREAADALLAWAVTRARRDGITGLRLSCPPGQDAKLAALTACGFVHVDDFLRMERAPVGAHHPGDPPAGTRWAGVDRGERERFRTIYNTVFDELPHSVHTSQSELAAQMDGDEAWPAATGMLLDGDNRPVAFLFGLRAGAAGVIEGIGTVASWRGRGVARWMVRRAVAVAAGEKLAGVSAMILASNAPSLAVHRGQGFREADRKPMHELRLPAA